MMNGSILRTSLATVAAIVYAFLGVSGHAAASDSPRWLTVAEVRGALLGRPAAGIYPDGTPWAEIITANGRADYSERGERRGGSWSFNLEGELCFRYDDGRGGGCFRYVQISSNCYEHFYQVFGPKTDSTGPDDRFLTNGRLWRTDEPQTCDEKPAV
ncbi:MAG TPA: hypothetical protein PK264_12035 [Hyphomicrobiaceae bacterium]|nr:hypothetical protein [Hyphomicrobiaceae bacterium]